MKVWRRIVSVIAGTMIAAGGVLATAAVFDTTPMSGPPPSTPVFDLESSRAAVQGDAVAVSTLLNQSASIPAPSLDERNQAALGALAIAEIAGAAPPRNLPESGQNSTVWTRADTANGQDLDGSVSSALDQAAAVAGDGESTPTGVFATDAKALSTPVTLVMDGVASADALTASRLFFAFSTAAAGVLHTPLAEAEAYSQAEPSDTLGLKGAATDPPASVANWSAAAAAELELRYDNHTLESDTLNLSLASQALREEAPAKADALNAELRYRQSADGSVGDIRSTSEAARALALGGSEDRAASVRALNWLDAQGTLAPPAAVYRLRAHAYDGMLVGSEGNYTSAPSVPGASQSGGLAIRGPDLSVPGGKSAMALWFLAGGIGLSLSLVTVDALKGARQRLYDTVRASPGLHVNELRRRLHMSPSSIEYHLSVLVGAGLVVSEDDGRYKRYYANGAGLGLNPRAPMSRNTLGALRRPHAVTLVRALADRGAPAAARDLARGLLLHESAVARRLAHLEDAGVLVSERQGRSRMYRLADPAAALKALAAVEEAPPVVSTMGLPVPLETEPTPTLGTSRALQ